MVSLNAHAQEMSTLSSLKSYYNLKQYEKVIEAGPQLLSMTVRRSHRELTLFLLGDSYFQNKQYEKAVEVLSTLLEVYPKSRVGARVHFIMASSYFYLNFPLNAVGHFISIIQNFERSSWVKDSHFWLGEVFYILKNYSSSNRHYQKYLENMKKFGSVNSKEWVSMQYRALYYSALCEYHLGHLRKCLLNMDKALELPVSDDKKSEALYGKTKALVAMGHFEDAIDILKQLKENSPKVFLDLGRVYYKIENYQEARKVFLSLITSSPDITVTQNAKYLYAQSFFKEQNFKKAIEVFKKYEPKDGGLYIGLSYYNLGQYKRALKEFEALIAHAPKQNAHAYYYAAWSELRLEKTGKALEYFEHMLKFFPKDDLIPDIIFWIVDYYGIRKEYDKQKSYLELIISRYATSDLVADAYYQLAILGLEDGRRDEALDYLEKIEPLNEIFGEALLMKMSIYLHKGKYTRVIRTLEPLIHEKSTLILRQNMMYFLGQAYGGLKDWSKAALFFKQSMYGHEGPIIISSMLALAKVLCHQNLWTEGLNMYMTVGMRMSRYKTEEMYFKAKLGAARCFEKLVQYDAANTMYKEVIQLNHPKYKRIAMELKSLLKMKRKAVAAS
jgi:tetratricopeptide (TPR) repeat protein